MTHELHSASDDRLVAALGVFEDKILALRGVWLVATHWSVEEVEAHLRQHLSEDDLLEVNQVAVGQEWSGWMRPEVEEWLRKLLGEQS